MRQRWAAGALALSAAGFVGIIANEGYTDRAVVPVEGDRPTVGFGSTFREDGTPVQMGDTTTPPKAVARSLSHVQQSETGLKRCVTGPLTQGEYDILVDFSYQYGTAAACRSSMVRLTNAGDYAGACEAYLRYRFVAGYDCSTPGNRQCWGVWVRSKERRDRCMEEQG